MERPKSGLQSDATVARPKEGRRRLGLWAGAASLGLSAVGCASVDDPRYALKDGWRAGRIEAIGPAASIGQPHSEDCRSSATPAQRQADRYAVVLYWSTVTSRRHPTGWIPRIVPLEAGVPASVGDAVYVNTLDCAAPVAARRS